MVPECLLESSTLPWRFQEGSLLRPLSWSLFSKAVIPNAHSFGHLLVSLGFTGSHVLHVATQAARGALLSLLCYLSLSLCVFSITPSLSLSLSPCFLLFSPSLSITFSHLSFSCLPVISCLPVPLPYPLPASPHPPAHIVGAGALLAGTVCVWV